jgi:hypothetical protein
MKPNNIIIAAIVHRIFEASGEVEGQLGHVAESQGELLCRIESWSPFVASDVDWSCRIRHQDISKCHTRRDGRRC